MITFSEMRVMMTLRMRLPDNVTIMASFIFFLKKSMSVPMMMLAATEQKPITMPRVEDHFSVRPSCSVKVITMVLCHIWTRACDIE